MKWAYVLGREPFSEHGRPTGVYWNKDRSLFAVASTFEPLGWSARELSEGLKVSRRISVYRTDGLHRLAVLNLKGNMPINDVAFRPERNELAIGTGRYDGGYFFEGELLLWNYEADIHRSMLKDRREVTACRFNETGSRLYVMLRPVDDGGFEEGGPFDTYEAYEVNDLTNASSVSEWQSVQREQTGIVEAYTVQKIEEIQAELMELSGKDFEIRSLVWDLIWVDDQEIASVSRGRQLELWDLEKGQAASYINESAGEAYELLSAGDGTLLVNCVRSEDDDGLFKLKSTLMRCDAAAESLTVVLKQDFPYSLSRNERGDMLGRKCWGTSSDPTPVWDFGLDRHFESETVLDLGHYDIFNHYLRINDAPELYLLQGTPASSHKNKWVCAYEPESSQVRRLFPIDTALTENEHLMSDGGCYCADDAGESLILAAHIYGYHLPGLESESEVLMRRALKNGETLWEMRFGSRITAVVFQSSTGHIWFALTEGKLGCVDSVSGKLLLLKDVVVEGVSTVVTSLAVRGEKIAAGTIEGWILVNDSGSAAFTERQ